ncbi:uncharacterized protein N7500_003125 [Penicillium coprophilum]|uniref:uncharacterized protein n=1 Tax=Penicillium coprophilum TaxID=36646 RepID=UPI00238E99E7|nr:uncharacterized protein N7500_003125 [Penicillium coprophilum]KAJ5170342.1 hypothetical protein N7500_003125 [Penicillium coprophilum]
MFDLFQMLHSWDQSCRLRLLLGLRGSRHERWPTMEPDVWYSYTAGAAGNNLSVPPYRACFVNNMHKLYLAHVPCIDKLSFLNIDLDRNRHHQIWTGAVETIIQHCPTISELELDLNEWIRPDYLPYIQGRRASLSSLLGNIPRSLRVFHYRASEDGPWKHSMPALNVIPSGTDSMTINLRDLSTHLRELKLNRTTLPFDFLCPLDGTARPILGSLHWPCLEIMELMDVPPWLPSGKWASNHTPEYRAEIESDKWNDRICDAERRWGGTSVMDEEQFHRLLISLGYATQRMPRLKQMVFRMECYCRFTLLLRNNTSVSTLQWHSRVKYRPDSRVAKAWKLDLDGDDMKIECSDMGLCSVMLPKWPPDEPM